MSSKFSFKSAEKAWVGIIPKSEADAVVNKGELTFAVSIPIGRRGNKWRVCPRSGFALANLGVNPIQIEVGVLTATGVMQDVRVVDLPKVLIFGECEGCGEQRYFSRTDRHWYGG